MDYTTHTHVRTYDPSQTSIEDCCSCSGMSSKRIVKVHVVSKYNHIILAVKRGLHSLCITFAEEDEEESSMQ